MKKYVSMIFSLIASVFGSKPLTEEDKVWQEWLTLEGCRRESHDLRELLNSDVRDEFKTRAMTVLLAPAFRFVPFKWEEDQHTSSSKNYLFNMVELNSLSEKLLRFAAELVCSNMDLVHKRMGLDEGKEPLCIYNNYIVALLGLIPADDELAQRLFDRFQLNDLFVFWNFDDASGYNPLENLFRAEHVPEMWKRLADEQMRQVIIAEVDGKATPREEWEEALSCYASAIQVLLSSERQPYSKDLFVSQIEFILGLPNVDNRILFNNWNIPKILERLSGDENRELRHRFAKHILGKRGEFGDFRVYCQETRAAAQAMVEEFGTDVELRTRLETIIAKGDEKAQEQDHQRLQQEVVRTEVLAKMK